MIAHYKNTAKRRAVDSFCYLGEEDLVTATMMMMERNLLSDQSRKKNDKRTSCVLIYFPVCGMWWFRLSTLGISTLFCLVGGPFAIHNPLGR